MKHSSQSDPMETRRDEATTPLMVDPSSHRNITDLLLNRLRKAPNHAAFEIPQGDGQPWQQISTQEFAQSVRALAKGIIACGISPGDSVALMAPTSYQWTLVDMAAFFAGAVVVPIYETSSISQTASIIADADVKLIFAGAPTQIDIVQAALSHITDQEIPLWSLDDLDKLRSMGTGIADSQLEEHRVHADLDSVATIVYTSGTGGEPKGAMITHRNMVGQILNIAAKYTDVVRSDGNTVIFLPLAHVLARGLQMICLANGMRIAHVADPKDAVASLATLRPTFLVVVPRVLQRIRTAAQSSAQKKHLGKLWDAAMTTAIKWARSEEKSPGTAPLGLRLTHTFFDALFFRRIRTLLGGRVDYLLSGAAYLDPTIASLFTGMGVPVIEGYGLTETTAPLTGNLPGAIRTGTVGPPQPGNTVRISSEGEVLARGIGIFAGYRNPTLNATAFVDGYFRTGDLGTLDADGYLTLTGRLKDVITTSGGKTISPDRWERIVEDNPLVAHAVIVGENRPYLSAFVLLDAEALVAWAEEQGHSSTVFAPVTDVRLTPVTEKFVLEPITKTIELANREVSRPEQIRNFQVLIGNLTPGSILATPTMKLRREAFLARADSFLSLLYQESSAI